MVSGLKAARAYGVAVGVGGGLLALMGSTSRYPHYRQELFSSATAENSLAVTTPLLVGAGGVALGAHHVFRGVQGALARRGIGSIPVGAAAAGAALAASVIPAVILWNAHEWGHANSPWRAP